jgi:hypothetical protein
MGLSMDSPTFLLDKIRDYARRELVFLALGTMDVCVITPLYAALLFPLIDIKPLSTLLGLLVAILTVHYLARLSFYLPMGFWLRSSLAALGMLTSGLFAIHHTLYAQKALWRFGWVSDIFASLGQDVIAQDILVFSLVVFLWWRGLVLAQRRLDSRSVAFRFRLGVILLAVTSGIAGSMVPWPHHHFVFLFFFSSLLGISLARAEEVGQQYGGRQSPFSLGWLATMLAACSIVLLMAAGLTSLLAGETLGRILRPILGVLQVLVFAVTLGLAWVAQFLLQPLMTLLGRYEIGEALQALLDQIDSPQPLDSENLSGEPVFTLEQIATVRIAVAILGASLLVLIVAISLYRLRARSGGPSNEKRESVWDGIHLWNSVGQLLKQGRRRLGGVTDALMQSRLSQMLAALTIRRIYAHMAALAARRGYPRAINETPYDYLPALHKAFPESPQEVIQITESYVDVHYGELPEREEELTAVQSAWHRIRGEVSGPIRRSR